MAARPLARNLPRSSRDTHHSANTGASVLPSRFAGAPREGDEELFESWFVAVRDGRVRFVPSWNSYEFVTDNLCRSDVLDELLLDAAGDDADAGERLPSQALCCPQRPGVPRCGS